SCLARRATATVIARVLPRYPLYEHAKRTKLAASSRPHRAGRPARRRGPSLGLGRRGHGVRPPRRGVSRASHPPALPLSAGRLVANKASEALKQTIVFENRPGASGLIAGEHVAKSAGDGYTLLVSVPSLFTIVPHMIEGASARIEGLVPVAQFAVAPLVLVVHPSVEAKNVKELVSLLKAPSATLDYASAGNGTLPHLAMELLLASVNGKAVHVPYKGSGPAAADLVGGQVKAMMDNMSSSLPHARSGKLRALAVTSGKRFAGAPDIPTLAESGV